jgi:hypothetical protein
MKKYKVFLMKNIIKLLLLTPIFFASCQKNIDLYPQSNITTENFYKNAGDIQIALNGCYNALRAPLLEEWKLTELRSDNTIMYSSASKSAPNRDLSDLDLFIPSTSHTAIYNYWIANYFNIRNVNVILNSLNVNYKPETGAVTSDATDVDITDAQKKIASSEATFIRAYHYFNLVRLYGGVMLIHEPVDPFEALTINRSSTDDIYKLIIADLQYAIANGSSTKYASIPTTSLGKVNAWAAKALLAKVYLTLNRKTDAIPLLNDIIANSGYGLVANYADVFAINNEMNKEIMFAVRYKAGGIAQGSPFPNLFAPELSGTAVINGDGSGQNAPCLELANTYNALDLRKVASVATYGTALNNLYPKKMIAPVSLKGDGENDWNVIRYADVLLMLAEAQGNTAASLTLINLTRTRAGLPALTSATVTTNAIFEKELATERRLEFTFENIRWFDLLRFNTTMPSINAVATIQGNFSAMWTTHYSKYPSPPSLATIQGYVTAEKLLLPIPQREIDNNTKIKIPQNAGY